MGVDICYFMDHDFEITTIENFLRIFVNVQTFLFQKTKLSS